MIYNSKHIEKCILTLGTNTHHDVKAFEVDGIVQNTKKLIPQEQYMIFKKNIKILELCQKD